MYWIRILNFVPRNNDNYRFSTNLKCWWLLALFAFDSFIFLSEQVWHFKKLDLGLEVRCGVLEFYSNPNSLDLNSAIKFWSPTHCLIKFYPALNWTGYARSGCSFVWGGVPSNINTKPFASFVNVRRRWQICLSPRITLNIQHEYITSGYITSPWQSTSPPCSKRFLLRWGQKMRVIMKSKVS